MIKYYFIRGELDEAVNEELTDKLIQKNSYNFINFNDSKQLIRYKDKKCNCEYKKLDLFTSSVYTCIYCGK